VRDLALAFLAVSCASLASQATAFARVALRSRGRRDMVSAGYLRTIGCRVAAAAAYSALAAVQLAGAGTLSTEALAVFTGVQALWVTNSLLDIRIRHRLQATRGAPAMPSDEARQLARLARITDDLDKLTDRLFANVAELRQLLAAAADERAQQASGGKEAGS
jgi:hypothetical protein